MQSERIRFLAVKAKKCNETCPFYRSPQTLGVTVIASGVLAYLMTFVASFAVNYFHARILTDIESRPTEMLLLAPSMS